VNACPLAPDHPFTCQIMTDVVWFTMGQGKGFAGMRKMCSAEGAGLARNIPWLYLM